MSDFPKDQDCDRTPADDQLDLLLAYADAELLAAISTAQTPAQGGVVGDTDALLAPPRWHDLPELVPETESHSSELEMDVDLFEYNTAVLAAEVDLKAFVDALDEAISNAVDLHGASVTTRAFMEAIAEWIVALQDHLRHRSLTKELANGYFDDLQTHVQYLIRRLHLPFVVQVHLLGARRSVLYLFDHADEFGDSPVPSRF